MIRSVEKLNYTTTMYINYMLNPTVNKLQEYKIFTSLLSLWREYANYHCILVNV